MHQLEPVLHTVSHWKYEPPQRCHQLRQHRLRLDRDLPGTRGAALLELVPDGLCGEAAFLSIQVITLEGWVEIMYYVMDAHSFYNFIYFILLIIVSTYSSFSSI